MPRTTTHKLCKPDSKGMYRPYIGIDIQGRRQRFHVGNVKDTTQGEAEQRLITIRELYIRQCKELGRPWWDDDILETAKQIASGQSGTVDWQHAKRFAKMVEHGMMEGHIVGNSYDGAERLVELVNAAQLPPAQPNEYQNAVATLREIVADEVRKAVAEIKKPAKDIYGDVVVSDIPDDPSKHETRTLHQALKAYQAFIDSTGDKDEFGKLSKGYAQYKRQAKWIAQQIDNCPLWKFDLPKIQEIVAYYRNRPETRSSSGNGDRCSRVHAKHMIARVYAFIRWLDSEPTFNWQAPNGLDNIKRVPINLPQDRIKSRARRITAETYTPDQLAIIAQRLDKTGKMMLGLAINCGMGPAEFGRVEIGDCFLNQRHPDADYPNDEKSNWLVFDRPKTGIYGEWQLWQPVADLVKYAIERSKSMSQDRLAIRDCGSPWYRDNANNGPIYISKWWQAVPSKTCRTLGIVTAINQSDPTFPRLTVKSLRKVLPNALRRIGNADIDVVRLSIAHSTGRSRMIDRYSDNAYDALHKATGELADHFAPLLDALNS